ncbi:hypothetical protein [Breoghania sp. L-A4]|uniref:hypothetical protein n=1 Tax=Breoghania sp. L-A4 TaxID=2304600 RepID=UPI000E35B4AE|nr:hypothetical protein [Breoghania sp. L-A4]AXS41157.1 hypothetical protein D1F64_15415 [Breoghania sp. L-A4]
MMKQGFAVCMFMTLLAGCASALYPDGPGSVDVNHVNVRDVYIVKFFSGENILYPEEFCPVSSEGVFDSCPASKSIKFDIVPPATVSDAITAQSTLAVSGTQDMRLIFKRSEARDDNIYAYSHGLRNIGNLNKTIFRAGDYTYITRFKPGYVVVLPPTSDEELWIERARETLSGALGNSVNQFTFVAAKRTGTICNDHPSRRLQVGAASIKEFTCTLNNPDDMKALDETTSGGT